MTTALNGSVGGHDAPRPPATNPTRRPGPPRSALDRRAAVGQGRAPRRRRRHGPWSGGTLPYLLLAPAICLELLIHLVPMAAGVWISLKKMTQYYIRDWSHAPGAGLSNYRIVVDTDSSIGRSLLQSLWTTVSFTLPVVAISAVLGFVAAWLLQLQTRGRGPLRVLYLIPYALPAYAAIIVWNFLLQRDTGMVNHLIVDNLHLTDDRPFWLVGTNSYFAIMAVAIWRTWPFAFLTYTSGIQNVPMDLYEAAAVDGAGLGQQVRRITIPMLRPITRVLLLVMFLWTFNDFNTPYVLFGASPPKQADLISVHIYQGSFVTWNFGVGSAMSVLLLLCLLVVTGCYLFVTRRRRNDAV